VPGYTWTEPDLQRRGPVITVSIAATAAAEAAARVAGSEIPDPVTVPALVDTGAGVSAVSPGTAQRLGLPPAGVTLVSTPSSSRAWLAHYAVRFLLPGGAAVEATAVEAELAGHGTGAILGRDVLAHAVFVYVGYAGQCTIAF
jgi:hypothetical protein